jgi:hypothetical protein
LRTEKGTLVGPFELKDDETIYLNRPELKMIAFDAETILIGGGIPSRDSKNLIYLFLMARILNADGEAVE